MLKGIPGENQLARMYYELSKHGAACEGKRLSWPYNPKDIEELFCLAADMSRYDPRLFSILVRFLYEKWKGLNPVKVRTLYNTMITPQTIAVISEFLIKLANAGDEEIYFLEYLQSGIKPVATQFYFHHLYVPGGNLMQRAIDSPLKEYKRWGFIGREAPILNDASRVAIGTHDMDSRRNILLKLLENGKDIKLSDYLNSLSNSISRQQALLDIQSISGIIRDGKGRGARWKLAA